MRDPIILLVHLIATLARLMGPGGLRSVVAESLLVKQQLLILNRSRHRAPNLRPSDRILAGVCALFMRPARVLRVAVVLRPSTILAFHRTLRACKYRWLFSPRRRRTGLWVANYYSARNPLRLSSLVILGVVARMFRCATRSSCWCT